MNQKKFKLILTIAAAFFAVLAIVLLIVGIVYDGEHLFTKILIIVVFVLSFVLALELVYLLWMSSAAKPNYFLYDSRTKKNVPVQKLSPQVINNRMNRYFAGFASSEAKLWTDGILDDVNVDISDEFKPLVAYKLLVDLAVMDQEKGWKCFEISSAATVDFICRGIEINGEVEIAKNLRLMKAVNPFNVKYVREYLVNNKAYLQAKMFRYVRDNIDKFE